jgi:hypothetical protein
MSTAPCAAVPSGCERGAGVARGVGGGAAGIGSAGGLEGDSGVAVNRGCTSACPDVPTTEPTVRAACTSGESAARAPIIGETIAEATTSRGATDSGRKTFMFAFVHGCHSRSSRQSAAQRRLTREASRMDLWRQIPT